MWPDSNGVQATAPIQLMNEWRPNIPTTKLFAPIIRISFEDQRWSAILIIQVNPSKWRQGVIIVIATIWTALEEWAHALIISSSTRLEIFQTFYTTGFLGQKIYTLKLRESLLFFFNATKQWFDQGMLIIILTVQVNQPISPIAFFFRVSLEPDDFDQKLVWVLNFAKFGAFWRI